MLILAQENFNDIWHKSTQKPKTCVRQWADLLHWLYKPCATNHLLFLHWYGLPSHH